MSRAGGAWLATVVALALQAPHHAAAQPGDLVQALNAARARGCDGHAGVRPALQEQAALARAARLIAGGADLEEALHKADYKAELSALLALQGPEQPAAIAAFLAERHCQHLLRPTFTEMGSHRAGRRTWIVLAAPFVPPAVDDADAVAQTVLQLVNQARAQARQCGTRAMPAAGPLRLNGTLSAAALGHARDMARNAYFDHTARDGSQPAQRATRAGYRWQSVGENIAAGQSTPQAAVAGWLKSPGHCVNLMQPTFQDMGIAFAVNKATGPGIYWVQMFGRAR